MQITDLHPWNVSPSQAQQIQEELRERLCPVDRLRPDEIRFVAGVDNAYRGRGADSLAWAVVVVLSFPDLEIVEEAYAAAPVTFPYVPGLLTFREAPAILQAFRQLRTVPDVVLFDGQGYAHFRRFGLASHLGVILDIPSIGGAKTRLTGRYNEPGEVFGDWTPLVDRGEVIGAAIRPRPGHTPLFVSIGNHITLRTAIDVVLACCRGGTFLPEPTRLAHALVTRKARSGEPAPARSGTAPGEQGERENLHERPGPR